MGPEKIEIGVMNQSVETSINIPGKFKPGKDEYHLTTKTNFKFLSGTRKGRRSVVFDYHLRIEANLKT